MEIILLIPSYFTLLLLASGVTLIVVHVLVQQTRLQREEMTCNTGRFPLAISVC
jgi:hypothetical protein